MRNEWSRVRTWYERNLANRALVIGAFWLIVNVPDWISREAFWTTQISRAWHLAIAHSTGVWILICTLIIVADNWRIKRKHVRGHDLQSLKGRTLQFIDDLEAFKRELGLQPEIVWKTGNTSQEFMEANEPSTIREQKMHHEFHMRFSDRAWHLWHEHGAERREDPSIQARLQGRIDSDDRLDPLIESFKQLADMTDD